MNTNYISTYQTKEVLALKETKWTPLPMHILVSRNAQHSILADPLRICVMANLYSYKPVTFLDKFGPCL